MSVLMHEPDVDKPDGLDWRWESTWRPDWPGWWAVKPTRDGRVVLSVHLDGDANRWMASVASTDGPGPGGLYVETPAEAFGLIAAFLRSVHDRANGLTTEACVGQWMATIAKEVDV